MEQEQLSGAEVEGYGSATQPLSSHRGGRLAPWQQLDLCRELASKEQTRTALAEKYGVSQPAISQFAKRHAQRIEEIRANLDDEFAGLWIAKKRNRITAYQADVELIDTKAQKDGATMADADMIRVKTTIMKAVAEELGQLPARVTVTVTPVEHIFMGVPMDELK